MTKDLYVHEIYPDGYVRFASSLFVFIRHRTKWEFYRVEQSGESRGLEMFAGYVEKPAAIAVLESAARVAWAMGSAANRIRPNHSHREPLARQL